MGAILQALREHAGLSRAEAAEKIGVKRQAVYQWEWGHKVPGPESLTRACEVYNASAGERMRLAHLAAFGREPSEVAAS